MNQNIFTSLPPSDNHGLVCCCSGLHSGGFFVWFFMFCTKSPVFMVNIVVSVRFNSARSWINLLLTAFTQSTQEQSVNRLQQPAACQWITGVSETLSLVIVSLWLSNLQLVSVKGQILLSVQIWPSAGIKGLWEMICVHSARNTHPCLIGSDAIAHVNLQVK